MKKTTWIAAFLAATLFVVVGVRTDWFGLRRDVPPTGTASVGSNGGTFTFADGLKVVVPAGAAPDGTTLTETSPTVLDKNAGPFSGLRSAGVRFDVSLKQSDGTQIEPQKPVDLIVPLQPGSQFVPNGATGMALPYTPNESGAGYLLLPAKPLDATQLQVRTARLSPKYLAYVSDDQLMRSFFPDKVLNDPAQCKQAITVGGHKAKIGGDSRGWSLKSDSAIYACLAEGPNGTVAIDIANRIDYILSVASTNNVRLAASQGSIDDQITKATAAVLFPKDRLKAYLVSDGTLVGATTPGDLPATIELQGDPNTFLAEATWRSLTFVAGLLTGTDGNKALAVVNDLLGKADVASCLQKAVDGKSLQDFSGGLDMISGCLSVITDAVYATFRPLVIVEWILDMANNAWQSGIQFTNGIKLTLANTLRVQVVSDDPAPKVPTCPTDAEIFSALRASHFKQNAAGAALSEVKVYDAPACQDGWASATVGVRYSDNPGPGGMVDFSAVVHWVGGQWIFAGGGQDMSNNPLCQQAPAKVRANMYCG